MRPAYPARARGTRGAVATRNLGFLGLRDPRRDRDGEVLAIGSRVGSPLCTGRATVRVLVVGWGVIGTTYRYVFAKAGHQVEHLVRPEKRGSMPERLAIDLLGSWLCQPCLIGTGEAAAAAGLPKGPRSSQPHGWTGVPV